MAWVALWGAFHQTRKYSFLMISPKLLDISPFFLLIFLLFEQWIFLYYLGFQVMAIHCCAAKNSLRGTERNSRNANNTNGYTRNVSISRETSTGTHQEHKGRNIMTAYNSRNPSNSRNESNNRTVNTVWTLSKAGILAKTVKPATAMRRLQQLRQ